MKNTNAELYDELRKQPKQDEVESLADEVAEALLSPRTSQQDFDTFSEMVERGQVFEKIKDHRLLLPAMVNWLKANRLNPTSFKVWQSLPSN
jgi:hypothetical protein